MNLGALASGRRVAHLTASNCTRRPEASAPRLAIARMQQQARA